jgi:rhodanese-related sulfurtransferase
MDARDVLHDVRDAPLSEWLARHIPGVRARLLEEDGHLTLIENHLEGVHEWLLERLG